MKRAFNFFIAVMVAHAMAGQIPANGLSLWLRADTGVTTSGSNVLSWNDLSTNKHHAITRTTDFPQFISHALNDLPVLRFNGLNNGMETVPFATFSQKRGTIFLVTKINGRSLTSGVGANNLVSTFHGKGTTWQFCATPTKYSYFDGAGAEGFPVSASAANNWSMVTIMRSNDTSMKIFEKGRLERTFLINNNQPDPNTLKIGYNGRLGGADADSIPEVLNGDIAEIIIYNRALSSTELSDVHNYLSVKYGMALRPPPFWERWWFYGLVMLLAASVVIMMVQFINHRKLKKQLVELEKQRQMDKERQRISREMHDDIGAGLTQITLMSESSKNKTGHHSEKELEDIAETSRKLVSSMSEIIWSLNPENKTLEQLVAYLREQLNKQLEYSGINYAVQLPDTGKEINLSNEQRRNILLSTKEIVNNAIKYSGAKNIRVVMTMDKNILTCTVEDDGIGFDTTQSYSGNGLKNIRHRIEELGGKFEIRSEIGKGSTFRYIVPL
jgi:signal transduction histidine kinase